MRWLGLGGVAGGWLALVGCMPVAHQWEDIEEFPIEKAAVEVAAPANPDELRVMTWNLKFGGARVDFFFDGWGERVHMSEAEVRTHMDDILELIDETQPDILLAQEVDVASKRSAFVDMAAILLEETDYNYAAWVPNWEVDYVPQEGLGRVKAGQAVFSKWPIVRNTRVDLPQSEEASAVVNYFWLHRAIQVVEVDLGNRVLTVVNNHPSAYALDGTKAKHLEAIYEWSYNALPPVISGGDFNVIPPGSLITEGFADNAPTDTPGVSEVSYTDEEMDAMLPFYEAFDAAVDLEDYQVATAEEQEAFLTHSVSGEVFWTQKLDYLFTTERWSEAYTLQTTGDAGVSLDAMQLSDHAPMLGVLVMP